MFLRLFYRLNLRRAATVAACAVFFAASGLCAQQEGMVSVRFTALSLDGPVEGVRYDSGDGSRPLWLSHIARSQQQRYTGPAQLVFYTEASGSEGEMIRTPVAVVDLAAFAGKEALLLFTTDKANPGRYLVFAVDDSRSLFPGNSWRVFNLTPATVAFQVADERPRSIASGSDSLFAFADAPQQGKRIRIAVENDGEWKIVRTSIWSHNPAVRSLVFLLPDGKGESVQVQRVNQSLYADSTE